MTFCQSSKLPRITRPSCTSQYWAQQNITLQRLHSHRITARSCTSIDIPLKRLPSDHIALLHLHSHQIPSHAFTAHQLTSHYCLDFATGFKQPYRIELNTDCYSSVSLGISSVWSQWSQVMQFGWVVVAVRMHLTLIAIHVFLQFSFSSVWSKQWSPPSTLQAVHLLGDSECCFGMHLTLIGTTYVLL